MKRFRESKPWVTNAIIKFLFMENSIRFELLMEGLSHYASGSKRTSRAARRQALLQCDNLDSVNITTPATATAPPSSERGVIFSPSNIRASGITVSGVSAAIDITMPVGVLSSAHCRQLTPSVWPARLFITTHGQMRRHLSRVDGGTLPLSLPLGRR